MRKGSQPELDFRVQAQLLLLQAEDVFVIGNAVCRILTSKKVENPGMDFGVFGPEAVDFLLYDFNLSRF